YFQIRTAAPASAATIRPTGLNSAPIAPPSKETEPVTIPHSAGEIFGNVLGGALQLVLTPAKMLLDTLAWILEKLGVLPDEA
ncbi:hypothetical protein ACSLOT_28030, partial [Escherichia coli]|uniref:hypothetical protein n=1 Tax=Escherichia coli TaxID=562 RepID=UPI003EE2CCAA